MLTPLQRIIERTYQIQRQLQMLRIETRNDKRLQLSNKAFDRMEGELNDVLSDLLTWKVVEQTGSDEG